MPNTPQFNLRLVQAAQSQKHITVNEALWRIDAALQLTVLDNTVSTPPVDPVEGDCYLIPFGASGDWSGRQNDIAIQIAGGWEFFRPEPGWRLHNLALGSSMTWDGVTWLIGDAAMSQNGAALIHRVIEQDHVVTSGAISTVAGFIPAGVMVTGITARVIAAVTGSATGWSLGVAGDTARYGTGHGKGTNSTVISLDSQPRRYDSATDLLLTGEGGTFTGGTIRFAVHLSYMIPPRP